MQYTHPDCYQHEMKHDSQIYPINEILPDVAATFISPQLVSSHCQSSVRPPHSFPAHQSWGSAARWRQLLGKVERVQWGDMPPPLLFPTQFARVGQYLQLFLSIQCWLCFYCRSVSACVSTLLLRAFSATPAIAMKRMAWGTLLRKKKWTRVASRSHDNTNTAAVLQKNKSNGGKCRDVFTNFCIELMM